MKSFVLFYSEISDPSRFASRSKSFKSIKTIDEVKALGIPILRTFVDPETNTTIIEFDLSDQTAVQEALKVTQLQFFPLLYVHINNTEYKSKDVVYEI